MGHGGGHTCCNKQKVKRGLWSPEEDEKLINYITSHGHGCWSSVPKLAGRTDNEVKNFWNSSIKKKLLAHTHHHHLSNHALATATTTTTTFPNPKATNIHVSLSGDHQYYEGLFDANPNVINPYQPHMIHDDQDHRHVHTPPPPAATQPPLINLDKCFVGIDPSPILPPLPPSFTVNPSPEFDHQFPTMEFLNSYDHNILKPENYDLILGQNSDHHHNHHPEIPFKLGDVELSQPIANSNELHTPTSSQTEYLETFVPNFLSSSPPSLVLPQFV
ncbi:Homeodomain-like protein, partial [Cynara cardunculus var. scolymus]